MLGVLPARLVGFDIGFGAILERLRLCPFNPKCGAGLLPFLKRIDAFADLLPMYAGRFAGVAKRHFGVRSKSDIAAAIADFDPKNPSLAIADNPKVQPVHAANGVATWFLQPRDRQRREFLC